MKRIWIKSIVLLSVTMMIMGTHYNSIQSDTKQNIKQPQTVPCVDLDKYLGEWYEQASIPAFFTKGCTNSRATYSWNPGKKSIKVRNSCTRNGKQSFVIGKATPQDQTNAKLTVWFQPTQDVPGQYWIVRLGKYYEYAVVSGSNYDYLWILSRQKVMSDYLYNAIIQDLKQDGYDVQKLKKTKRNE